MPIGASTTRADDSEEPVGTPNELPEDADTATGSLEATTIHDVLSNERRRMLLSIMLDGQRSYTLRELSERLAERESGVSPAPRNVRQSVYVSLQQTHVPQLERLDILKREAADNTVGLSDRAEDVTVYLEVVPRYGLAWSEYYLGVGLLGLLTIVATVVNVPLVARVPVVAWAVMYLAVIVLSAGYHTWTMRSTVLHRLHRR